MSVFLDCNHMVLRSPYGSEGNVAAMRDAGFGAIYCNVKDFAPETWRTIRDRAAAAGVECGPWARTCSDGKTWDEALLQRLVSIADGWGSSLIVNSEKELDGSGDTLTRHIADVLGDRDWALSVEAWPFASVDWSPIKVPVLPQIFPAESPPSAYPDDCRNQWYLSGVRCVVFTFGAYGGMTPSMFDRLSPYGVYTADDCSGRYSDWGPLGTHTPCVGDGGGGGGEDDMKPITDEQARDSVKTATQAALSAYTDPKPRGRNTINWRIANADDTSWNKARDDVKAALDRSGVPDVPV